MQKSCAIWSNLSILNSDQYQIIRIILIIISGRFRKKGALKLGSAENYFIIMLPHVENCGNSGHGRLVCHGEVWCFNFVADFSGKGQPVSNCTSFLLTCTMGSAFLCWHAGTDTVAESQMIDCLRKAFSVPLLSILWEGACIHTETHWNHRSFLQVQICFFLKQFPKPCFMWKAQLTRFCSTS